jgi:hypothetical protein
MRRLWATIVAVWATLAIVGFLAWTRPQPAASPTRAVATSVVVTGRNGVAHILVVRQPPTAHATTQTSPVPLG